MSTPPPPDTRITIPISWKPEVSWKLFCEDGSLLDNVDGQSWASIAHDEKIDGQVLSLTTMPIVRMTLTSSFMDSLEVLLPRPLPCFAFARRAAPFVSGLTSHWLYSLFGYVLPEYLFTVKLRPDDQPVCHLLPRPALIIL